MGVLRTSVLWFVAAVGLSAPPSFAGRAAVLVVGAEGASPAAAGQLSAYAEQVRTSLRQRSFVVMSTEETTSRMGLLGAGGVQPIKEHEERLRRAEDAFASLELDRSVVLLEEALRLLAEDGSPDLDKQRLLEASRVRAAVRLLGLAGLEENGEGRTPLGQRALAHLMAALRTNPGLTLSEREHPPKVRRLLARAQETLARDGRGSLQVVSSPQGAVVVVEGRALGVTPLTLTDALPTGRYRVWTTLAPAESAVRWVRVDGDSEPLRFDLAFEGLLWPEGSGIRPTRGLVVDQRFVDKLGALLGVSEVVLVGLGEHERAPWLYVVACTAGQRSEPWVSVAKVGDAIDWERMLPGVRGPTDESFLSPSRFSPLRSIIPPALWPLLRDETAHAEQQVLEHDRRGPILWGSIGVGFVLVVGAAAATGTALWLHAPSTATTSEGPFRLVVSQ
ncbi:MAG: PEGA domain-containing protein [Myxococcota bacterium]